MKSNCLTCGIEFSFSPSQKTGKYCSNKCQQKYQSNKLLTEWLNGEYDSKKGVIPKVAKKWISEQQNHKCLMCGISDWNDKPITFQFDHIDGNPDNNTKENIRMICPNCHSQTETYGVKNKKSKNSLRNVYRRQNYQNRLSQNHKEVAGSNPAEDACATGTHHLTPKRFSGILKGWLRDHQPTGD